MTDLATVEEGICIDIGECCLDTDADIALSDAGAFLDDDEYARAQNFVFGRDRERFIRAHGYLRRQLGAFVRMAPKDVPIVVGNGGKPFVKEHRVNFSLSHSGSRAVVAMTRGGDVGIDLEIMDRGESFDEELDGLSAVCLTGEEQEALAFLPPERRARRFLSYWTAKEARMKLTGEGLSLDPRAIALDLSDGLPVGYLRPHAPHADLRFVPLSRPDEICCLAMRHGSEAILTYSKQGKGLDGQGQG
jgi:4'-phosphopantetheinyl transferase